MKYKGFLRTWGECPTYGNINKPKFQSGLELD